MEVLLPDFECNWFPLSVERRVHTQVAGACCQGWCALCMAGSRACHLVETACAGIRLPGSYIVPPRGKVLT